MKIIDSHCHLVDEKVLPTVGEIIERAKLAGVERFVTMAGGRTDWPKLVELANKYSEVFVAFGWHPEDLKQNEKLDDLQEILRNKKAVAIGEVGLDFYWDKEKTTKRLQVEMFENQIDLAKKLNKPLIIHCRGAEEEMIEILKNKAGFRAHFHCFGESKKLLEMVLANNHMVSFGGNVTFKSAQNLRNLLKIVPLKQLLLETDSPYLTPEPLRGRLNEPAFLIETAHFVAKELKIEVEELSTVTYQNTLCFFGLEK